MQRVRVATAISMFLLGLGLGARAEGEVPSKPVPKILAGTTRCRLPLWFGSAKLNFRVIVQPETEWLRNGSAKVDFIAEAVIPASLTQLIMDLPGHATTLTLSSLRTELHVAGAIPSSIRIVGQTRTYDLDPNEDGLAEDVHVRIVAPTQTITNDGSPSVGFRIEHFVATLEGLPLVGSLVMSDTKPPSTARRPCKLASETLGFGTLE